MSTVALPMTPPSAAHDGSTSVRIFGPSADFIPIRILGHGDIGTVFLVALRQSKQPYAVKVMQKDVLQRKGVKRAATERAVLSMVDHPFLPTLYAYSESAKHVFFLIDFCSGGDLNVFRHKQPNKKCSEAIIKFYAAEIVVALEYLHNKGIIYRDLKPENILIQSNGHIMLTDFDLSLVVERRKEEEREPKSRWAAVFSCFSGQQGGCSEKKKQGNTGPVNGDRSALQNNGVHHIPNDQFPAQALKAQKHVFHLKHRWPRKVKQTKGNVSACRSHSFVGTEEYVAPEVLWGNGHGFSVDCGQ